MLGVAVLLAALLLAVLGGPYGAITGAALAIGGAGCIAVGAVCISRGAPIPGDLLVIAGAGWLLPAPVAWLAAAIAWTTLGSVDGRRPGPWTAAGWTTPRLDDGR